MYILTRSHVISNEGVEHLRVASTIRRKEKLKYYTMTESTLSTFGMIADSNDRISLQQSPIDRPSFSAIKLGNEFCEFLVFVEEGGGGGT